MPTPPFRIKETEQSHELRKKLIKTIDDIYSKITRSDRVVSVIEERIRPSATADLSTDTGQYLLTDGSRELSADWDAGSHKITAETLGSDVATGTAPLVIASTTKVSNLNADKLDDKDITDIILADGTQAFTGNMRTGGNWISSDGDNEGIMIDTAGYVGINKTTPATIFDCNGNAYIGDTINGHYTEFETDGTVKFNGDATVWGEVEFTIVTGSTGNPDWQSYYAGKSFVLSNAAKDIVSGRVNIPGDYKEGSDIYVFFHWSPDTSITGNVVFGYDYRWENIGGTFGAGTNEEKTISTGATADAHLANYFTAISGTGKEVYSELLIDFYRAGADAADTYGGDIYVHSVTVRYQKDTVGSRTSTAK